MPKTSEKRQRQPIVNARFSPEELARLDDRRGDMSRGSYLRKLVLDDPGPRSKRRPSFAKASLSLLLGAISAVGGEVRQLADAAEHGDPVWHKYAERMLIKIEEICDLIRNHLGQEN